ncbi:spore coat protein, U domain family [Bacteriovorax sp. BAL6_X]|uniref:spore coat protein U domain-containing protein n=1 Tax=Bacteriovorax sp. BAL6_X TaxID=1201290 RepID=UPI0003860C87|nr:spore coat protein U domain-containing protein [Bacteriovorax sp. BAL6_X]EPZ51698.1 spore coat protein, U domain family [Bacteriovorax sp. BAL6_X]
MTLLKVILIMFFVSSVLAAKCNLNVSVNNFVGTISSTVQAVSHPITISRSKNPNQCKTIRAFFSTGQAGNYNRKASTSNNWIPYNLYSDSNMVTVLKDIGDATQAGEFSTINLPSSNYSYQSNFYIKQVDLDTVFSSGSGYFGDNLQISFYSVKNNGQLDYETTAYFYLQLVVPRYAELSLVPLGSPHDPNSTQYVMNFGNLTSQDVKSASLNVKGNVGFGVYMTSQNGSKLKNSSSSVPYQIKVGPNNYRSLSNAGQETYIFQRNNGTSINAESYPIYVKLGNVPANAPTGDYEDVITVTVKAW